MLNPSSALIVYRTIYLFLDTSASAVDQLARTRDGSQEVAEVHVTTKLLKELSVSEDISKTHTTHKSSLEAKQTGAERATQEIHNKAIEFADRFVPILQSCRNSASKKGDGMNVELPKHRKDLDTLRSECTKCLYQLLSTPWEICELKQAVLRWPLSQITDSRPPWKD